MAIGNPSLAARCTSCQTVFRVVPDQLRVSGGWVRCGRCAAVFNAAENLVELDDGVVRRSVRLPVPLVPLPVPDVDTRRRPTEPGWSPMPEPTGIVATSDGALPPAWADTDIRAYSGYRDDGEDAGFVVDAEPPVHDSPAAPPPVGALSTATTTAAPTALAEPAECDLPAKPDEPDDPYGPDPLSRQPPQTAFPAHTEPAVDARQAPLFDSAPDAPAAPRAPPSAFAEADEPQTGPAALPTPSFVRSADRAARWQSPQVLAALGGLALAAALGLVAQVLFEYRDLAAARWPVLRPVLVALCDVAGCRVEPARSIDGLAVESSGLSRIERSDRYRLNVTLRNRAGIDLALPALDLSLTDGQGKLVARRVLPLAEIGATQPTLAAGREISLQATLRAAPGSAGDPVAGYTIELFYP